MRAKPALGVVVSLCLLAEAAGANGRFPRAERLKELSPDTLLLTGTYGLLVTSNAGKDWHFVCESLLFGRSARGSWIDPLFELLSDGTIVSGSPHALRVSRDLGCTFSTETALPVDPTYFSDDVTLNTIGRVVDLTPVVAAGPGQLVALTTLNDAEGRPFEHRLYRTTDGARSWQAFGSAIPVATAQPVFTIDVAPSDPARIYVSGSSGSGFVLLRSEDEGVSWQSAPIAIDDESGANGAYIAGVSPSDPEQLYVRVPRWIDDLEEGVAFWDDSLLFSSDGGQLFTDILRRRGNLLGFALSPDGATVLAGFGDPNVAPIFTDEAALGIYRAAVADHVFEQLLPALPVSCLTWTQSALYVCAREYDPLGTGTEIDFHLARSTAERPADKADFTTLLKLKDVRGPAPWSDGRPSECSAEWLAGDPDDPEASSACQSMNACDAASVPLSEGATLCSPPAGGGTGGSGAGTGGEPGAGSGGVAGATPSGGSAGTEAGGAAGPRTPPSSSCGCRASPRTGHAGLLIAVALMLLRRTRRHGLGRALASRFRHTAQRT